MASKCATSPPAAFGQWRYGRRERGDIYRRLGRYAIVAVMEAAHVRGHDDPAGRCWRDWSCDRRVLLERLVRSRLHVAGNVPGEDPPQPCLVDGDDVIEALASNRTNDAFCVGVLPR